MSRCKSSRAGGFTLVELLVALVILALMAAFSYRALASAVEAERQVRESSRVWLDLAIFFDQFERDAMQAVSRPVRDRLGVQQASWVLRSPEQLRGDAPVEWTRLADDPAEDSRRVGYRVVDGKLQYLQWPVLDRAPTTEPRAITLADKVTALRLRCLSADGRWLEIWPIAGLSGDLPRAVELTLEFEDGNRLSRLIMVGGG